MYYVHRTCYLLYIPVYRYEYRRVISSLHVITRLIT